MAYGQKGNTWHVNSAQGVSRDRVDETFGKESRGDGSVSLSYIETITSGADLKGKWEILSYIEKSLLPAAGQVGLAGRRAARRQAQRIMREYPMPTTDKGGVPYISRAAELDGYLDKREAAIREGQLERGAALKQRPWVWHVSGPRSDDH